MMHPLSLSTSGSLRRILCLGAHCDDIEIGCGGTLLQILTVRPGLAVDWVIFSGTPGRTTESRTAASEFLAGAGHFRVTFRDHADGLFPAAVPALKADMEALRLGHEPDLILTHHLGDRHQDHRVIAELTWQVFRDHLIWEYEIPKYDGDIARPNVYVPLDAGIMERKIGILQRAFASQAGKHWFTADTFRALARLRGIESRAASGWAEAFHGRKSVVAA